MICKVKGIFDCTGYCTVTCALVGGKVEKYISFAGYDYLTKHIGKFVQINTYAYKRGEINKTNKKHSGLDLLYGIFPMTGMEVFRYRKGLHVS